MYININTDLVVTYFYVCVIFKVISRSNKGQIIEKWAFLSKSTKFLIYFYDSLMHSSFSGIGLLVLIL